MRFPRFLYSFILLAVLDVVGLFLVAHLLPDFSALLIIMLMLYGTPLLALPGAFASLQWVRELGHGTSDGLARLLVGSSLCFLVCTTAVYVVDPGDNFPMLMAYLYFAVQAQRLAGAGVANLILSLPLVLVCSESIARVSGFASALTSGVGLLLFAKLSGQLAAATGTQADWGFLLYAIVVGFGYGLCWGAFLHWLGQRKRL